VNIDDIRGAKVRQLAEKTRAVLLATVRVEAVHNEEVRQLAKQYSPSSILTLREGFFFVS